MHKNHNRTGLPHHQQRRLPSLEFIKRETKADENPCALKDQSRILTAFSLSPGEAHGAEHCCTQSCPSANTQMLNREHVEHTRNEQSEKHVLQYSENRAQSVLLFPKLPTGLLSLLTFSRTLDTSLRCSFHTVTPPRELTDHTDGVGKLISYENRKQPWKTGRSCK